MNRWIMKETKEELRFYQLETNVINWFEIAVTLMEEINQS